MKLQVMPISYRAALFGALCRGRAEITGFLEDTACVTTSFPGFIQAVNGLAGGSCVVPLP